MQYVLLGLHEWSSLLSVFGLSQGSSCYPGLILFRFLGFFVLVLDSLFQSLVSNHRFLNWVPFFDEWGSADSLFLSGSGIWVSIKWDYGFFFVQTSELCYDFLIFCLGKWKNVVLNFLMICFPRIEKSSQLGISLRLSAGFGLQFFSFAAMQGFNMWEIFILSESFLPFPSHIFPSTKQSITGISKKIPPPKKSSHFSSSFFRFDHTKSPSPHGSVITLTGH